MTASSSLITTCPLEIYSSRGPTPSAKSLALWILNLSGFFPALEEFVVNDYVDNGEDWPNAAYDAYLQRLEQLGVSTPAAGIEKEVWEQAHQLGQVLEHISPVVASGRANRERT